MPRYESVLVLWDIDKTLVDIGDISRDIYAEAFQAVTGTSLRRVAELPGRTERAIVIETLALHGIPAPESRLDDFYAALAAAANGLRAMIRTTGRSLRRCAAPLSQWRTPVPVRRR